MLTPPRPILARDVIPGMRLYVFADTNHWTGPRIIACDLDGARVVIYTENGGVTYRDLGETIWVRSPAPRSPDNHDDDDDLRVI